MAIQFGFGWLRSFVPGAPKMTMLAALLFVASSLLVIGLRKDQRRSVRGSFFMGTLTMSILFTVFVECVASLSTGLAFESPTTLNPFPGYPSPCTLTGFAFIAAGGLAWAFRWWGLIKMAGSFSALIGLLACVGYLFNIPKLYCYFGPESTAMAIPTAICLVVIGLCEWETAKTVQSDSRVV